MLSNLRRLLEMYSHFVSNHSYIMLAAVLIITVVMSIGSTMVGTKYMENRDIIPERFEVIKAYGLLEDNFGSETNMLISLEVNPGISGSNEIRDVRDPRVIKYLDTLTKAVESERKVGRATSSASILRMLNGGVLPQVERDINKFIDNDPSFRQYVSEDYTMTLVRIELVDVENSQDEVDAVFDVQGVLEQTDGVPPGASVSVAGGLAVGPVVTELVGPDVGRTFQASSIGIIIVSFLVFASIRYGINPVAVIFLGIIWAFGILGFMGYGLSAETSGTISMIMGIGIDFGIQITSRFREEVRRFRPERAMEITMNNVFMPLATTTLAALIGFRAMSMGQLTFFKEFGDIMSIGILASFLVAITLVPAILVLGERFAKRFRNGPVNRLKIYFEEIRR